MTSKNVVRLLFMMSLTTVGSGQSSGGENVTDAASSGITCGLNTELDESTNQCYCSAIEDRPEDPSRIYIAGLMDENAFPWCRDLFEFTVEQINLGRWGALNQSESQTLEYSFRNTECSEFMVLKEYWDLRGLNGNKPMDGVVGERCSDASITLGRICGLEEVPQISPSSNADSFPPEEFPFFNRAVAPNNEKGEVGALVSLLRFLGWKRVTLLLTNHETSKSFALEFGKMWNDNEGEIPTEITIPLNNETIQEGDIQTALGKIPIKNPSVNSRVVVLAAHVEHAFEILEYAHLNDFQDDTIWVGNSLWVGREPTRPYQLPELPGYLGVGLYHNRDEHYQDFMASYKPWLASHNKTMVDELPAFAAETVDSIVALTKAIAFTPFEMRNGESVVKTLRQLGFPGVSGPVRFTPEGDRKDPRYAVYNAKSKNEAGDFQWTLAGDVTKITNVNTSLEELCFAKVGCNLKEAPADMYPMPSTPLAVWATIVIALFGLLFVFFAWRYRRSRMKKNRIKAELEAFRKSVVGLRAAECDCIPRVCNDIECGVESAVSVTDNVHSVQAVQWCWQETAAYMNTHGPNEIHGDPADCWIKYNVNSNDILEEAFEAGKSEISPLSGYVVNFSTMQQIKLATTFARDVKRVVETGQVDKPKVVDLSKVRFGVTLPTELVGEPQMVLVSGDMIQIQTQRDDGWAFGSKIYHADESKARQLLVLSTGSADGVVNGKVSVLTDSGWFPLDHTRMPSTEDLTLLQQIGSTGDLDPPGHWDPIADATVVQRHVLQKGDPESQEVVKAFMSTLCKPWFRKNVTVLKVERIQNFSMWQTYIMKRQTICYRETGHTTRDNDSDSQRKALERFERRWLWHGTNVEVMDKIIQQGFNRSFCGKNATAYGKGVYFARDAWYSADPTYAVPCGNGLQYMMACRVVVGEYCRGQHDALTPDVRDPKTHSLYDSTVGLLGTDTMAHPSIYVTYHDAQSYPEYLITFKTRE